jgi:hypothetical protein
LYSNLDAPFATKRDRKAWAKLLAELDTLKAAGIGEPPKPGEQTLADAELLAGRLQSVQRKEGPMPKKKPLHGVGSKEQRMYEHIKESAQKSGRYGKRAKEVSARTVMKHHSEEGHQKGQ